MIKSGRFIIVLILTLAASGITQGQRRDLIKINYPDSLKSIGLKLDVWSVFANHIMTGFEVPLKKNRFFELGMGISGLASPDYYYEEASVIHKGFVLRSGFKFPIVYTSALSMCYLMPEYAFTGYKAEGYDYNISTMKTYAVRSQALLLSFGYRHVNPRSGFFYDIGMGYGLGFTNNVRYGFDAYTFFINTTSYYNGGPGTDQSYSDFATTFRGSVGLVLKKKKR